MKLNLSYVYETDLNMEKRFKTISDIFKGLIDFQYRFDNALKIEYLGVKVILKRNRPGFEEFVKPRKLIYREKMTINNPISGEVNYDGFCTYDLKISNEAYDELLDCSEDRLRSIICDEFIDSCEKLRILNNKVPEANVDEFIRRTKLFFDRL
ncbi:MAG: hypothetical protein KKE30_13505 [Gammaproteobacteria bacterium]|nr:hypothetical protein [Gammaproteobacteria bacterium]MBU1553827.1 hypothetical protein [Gammaproteobacteria bacterium]MBU2070509.1 hypothetical protein [Gammaproteobacteria bacterium]MBU2185310.1 hypothetical protein [Gammaproteobacteria bacterium]